MNPLSFLRLRKNPRNVATPAGHVDLYVDASGNLVLEEPDGTKTTVGSVGGGGTWGSITGTLSAQTDLQSALNAKVATASLADESLDLTFGSTLTSSAGAINLGSGVIVLDGGGGNAVFATDIEITEVAKGLILKSPDGTRWRVEVTDAGALTTTSL